MAVGIFIVVYSSVDPINTPCSSCPSCHSTQGPNDLLVNQTDVEPDNDVHIVGSNMERYTGCEFSAIKEWMEWNATSHM